jgi:hypothetical protein
MKGGKRMDQISAANHRPTTARDSATLSRTTAVDFGDKIQLKYDAHGLGAFLFARDLFV